MVGSILEYDTPKFQIMKEKDRQRNCIKMKTFVYQRHQTSNRVKMIDIIEEKCTSHVSG